MPHSSLKPRVLLGLQSCLPTMALCSRVGPRPFLLGVLQVGAQTVPPGPWGRWNELELEAEGAEATECPSRPGTRSLCSVGYQMFRSQTLLAPGACPTGFSENFHPANHCLKS